MTGVMRMRRAEVPERGGWSPVQLLTLLAAAGALYGCREPLVPEPPPEPPPDPLTATCATPGGLLHQGALPNGEETWRAADNPHRLRGTVRAVSVTVEAGVLVCAEADAALEVWRLTVRGTEALPVRFTAVDSTARWAGIAAAPWRAGGPPVFDFYNGPESQLTHVVIEHAHRGFWTLFPLTAQDLTIRRSGGSALSVGKGAVSRAHIDRACEAGSSCVALSLGDYGGVTLDDVRITNSGGFGITGGYRSHHVLRDIAIVGSQNTGLVLSTFDGDYGTYTFEGALSITGGGGRPAEVPVSVARQIAWTAAAQRSLTGNALDTIAVYTGYGPVDDLVIDRHLAWRIWGGLGRHTLRATLEPGSHLTVHRTDYRAELRLNGTAADPVQLVGVRRTPGYSPGRLFFEGEAAETTVIRHARIRDLALRAAGAHVLHVDDVVFTRGALELLSPGSSVRRSRFEGAMEWDAFPPSEDILVLGAGTIVEGAIVRGARRHGIRIIGDGVRVARCAVSGSAADGIHVVNGTGIVISQCNIEGNAETGVRNDGAATVDAGDNWWGSPAGPGAAGADRVAGPVLTHPFRAAPVDLATLAAGHDRPTGIGARITAAVARRTRH
jgi:hypothetical protein